MSHQELVKEDQGENLEKAIMAYQHALEVYGREDFPLQWAEIQNNLGDVYQQSQELKKPISSARNNQTTAAETLEELPSIIVEEKSKSENTNTLIINQPIKDKNIIWKRSNQILALASGGAFLGGIVAQIPGSIIGAVIAAIYGIMVKEKNELEM